MGGTWKVGLSLEVLVGRRCGAIQCTKGTPHWMGDARRVRPWPDLASQYLHLQLLASSFVINFDPPIQYQYPEGGKGGCVLARPS